MWGLCTHFFNPFIFWRKIYNIKIEDINHSFIHSPRYIQCGQGVSHHVGNGAGKTWRLRSIAHNCRIPGELNVGTLAEPQAESNRNIHHLFDFLHHSYFYLKVCYSFAYLFIVIYLPTFYSELHKENRRLFHYKLSNV